MRRPQVDEEALRRAASTTPNAVIVNAPANISNTSTTSMPGSYGTPARPASARITSPWNVTTTAPPRTLPTTIAERLTGATSISRKNPNSRSHTIEAAENIPVNITDIAMTPGK